MAYEAPTVVRYGTVTGLTSSFLKCSPGTDAQMGKVYFEHDTGGGQHWHATTDVGSGEPDEIAVGQEPAACLSGSAFFDLHS